MRLSKYLGDGEFWRGTMRIAVPIALQNLLASSFSLVDTIMLSRLGDVTLSAVGMAGQWSWLLSLVLFGFCSGCSVFVAQFWGVRDIAGIRKVYGITLLHSFAVSLLFCAAGAALPSVIVGIFNNDAAVIASGASYLRIAAFSYPAIALTNVFSTVLRSTEQVRLPLAATFASTVLNAVLNYILIFGKLGLPALGERGAAIATVIAAWVSPAFILAVSCAQRNILCARLSEIFGFSRALLRRFYRVMLPVLANESMWGLGTFCYNIIFARLGYEYYAAITVYRTVDNIMFTFFIGLCNACCVMVGKPVGSGDFDRAKADALRFAFIVPLLAAVVGALTAVFRAPLTAVFNLTGTLSALTSATAQTLLLMFGCEYCLRMIPYIMIVGVFRSGGDTASGTRYDIVCLWGIALPLVALTAFVLRWPFTAVFLVMLLAEDLIKVVLCVRRFRSMKWIRPVTSAREL